MDKKLDLVLVKPGGRLNLYSVLGTGFSGFAPPLDIGLLAAYLREQGYSIRIIDADAQSLTPKQTADKIIECNPLLAGIFAHTIRMMHASETLKILQDNAPHIRTLLGGRHPTALPEKTLCEEVVDYLCYGEGFYPLAGLLQLLRAGRDISSQPVRGIWYKQNGNVVPSPRAELLKDLDELPLIAWDLLPVQKYKAHNWQCFDNLEKRQPYAIIYSSIGCPFNCSYCVVNTVFGGPAIRLRSPAKIVEEIDFLVRNYNVRNLRMVDDLFTFKPDRVVQICDLIIQRGYDLNIWVYGRVDAVNKTMLSKMKQAGMHWICYGIEAGRESVREGVHKKISPEKIRKGLIMTKDAGINIIANFIFGLPDDNLETMQQTLDMAKEYNFEYVNFYCAMAWPGSKLYEDSVTKGLRLPDTWSGYAQLSEDTLPLPTKHISEQEVLRFRDKAFVEYFSGFNYQRMIEKKFGHAAVEHVRHMLKKKIPRKYT